MKELQETEYQSNFQKASSGGFGHNVLLEGQTSPTGNIYHALYVIDDCVISYDNAIKSSNDGDLTVSALFLKRNAVVIVGVIKNIQVTTGSVMAHLISIPK